MTIKTKLLANVLLTAAIVIGISMASLFSMRFLQEKLSYLTEKSTPFQMLTIEFQRDLQSSITNLTKLDSADDMTEYTAYRAEAEKSLDNVRKTQEMLSLMSSDSNRLTVSDELAPIANELFAAAEARIKSDIAAATANAKISNMMKVSTSRLKELDSHIRNLQVTRSAAFTKALESTGRLSADLRDLEDLRNQLKELNSVTNTAHNAITPTAFLIAQGKIKTLLGRISRNKHSKNISYDLQVLTDDINEFFQLQSAAIFKKNDDSKIWAAEAIKMLTELMNRMILTLNQDIELASSKLAIETNRQRMIFAQSNSANNILLTNSELVALGLTVTGDINRLFTVDSPKELDMFNNNIRSTFNAIHEHAVTEENSLAKLEAKEEQLLLHSAHASLEAIRADFYAPDGIVATLKKKLDAIEQANKSADKLQAIVIKQSVKGNDNVLLAQGEQEKSIIEVNQMVQRSLSRIVGIGSAAIIIGLFLGLWIYRSVMKPLRVVLEAVSRQKEQGKEKALLAKAIASGDLNRNVIISEAIIPKPGNDEMGMVLKEVAGMSVAQVELDKALAGMTESLRCSRDEEIRRDHLKSGLYELNKILRGDHDTNELGEQSLAFLAGFLGAGVGIMYLYDDKEGLLRTLSTYAISRSDRLNSGFRLGEGLPGQVAHERKMILLTTVPPDYLPITSALGKADPLNVAIMPVMHNDILVGVLELGSFRPYCDDDFEFLTLALEGIAIAINANRSHQRVNELLEQTQAQAEELRVQQEELQQTNEELVERAHILAEQRNFNVY